MEKKIILTKSELNNIIYTCISEGISTQRNYPKNERGDIGQNGLRCAEESAMDKFDTEIKLFLED